MQSKEKYDKGSFLLLEAYSKAFFTLINHEKIVIFFNFVLYNIFHN